MKQVLNVYTSVFLKFTIIIACFLPLAFIFRQNVRSLDYLGFPLVLVLMCTTIIATAHILGVRKAASASAHKNSRVNYGVRQALEVDIRETPQQLFIRLGSALRIPKWEPAGFDERSGRMTFETSGSLLSSGEIVDIFIAPAENGSCKVKVTSRPLLPFASVDFGKNKRNVSFVERILSASKPGQQPS